MTGSKNYNCYLLDENKQLNDKNMKIKPVYGSMKLLPLAVKKKF